jgi:hypothetical protein
MIDDDIFRAHSSNETQQLMIINPGSAYLRILQYYTEEKEISQQIGSGKLYIWEKFISKYFSPNIEMSVKFLEKEKLLYEII